MIKNLKTTIILGIDPGIADTGFGVIRQELTGKLTCISYGSIKTKVKTDLPSRLLTLNRQLELVIQKYQPDLVSIEELFFCNNVKTALVVGQARGVALLTVARHELPIYEFTPLQVKQAVSTYGKASKLQVQKMVKLLLNLKELPKPDDAADALAIAICASNTKLNISING